eukprot:TRINITY_DN21429_c0_g2_i1.p1 TRINITY_DN21429_c0_g2~~TRINITY_DN21429_c0_g2_i1.p1  ORF type:complete len:1788 (+),score=322.23 TRINITY_DN21429_c0_g2_i1:119-5365(+)
MSGEQDYAATQWIRSQLQLRGPEEPDPHHQSAGSQRWGADSYRDQGSSRSGDPDWVPARGEVNCCNLGCTRPGSEVCGACTQAFYCSAACQHADWGRHKALCKLLRQALEKRPSPPPRPTPADPPPPPPPAPAPVPPQNTSSAAGISHQGAANPAGSQWTPQRTPVPPQPGSPERLHSSSSSGSRQAPTPPQPERQVRMLPTARNVPVYLHQLPQGWPSPPGGPAAQAPAPSPVSGPAAPAPTHLLLVPQPQQVQQQQHATRLLLVQPRTPPQRPTSPQAPAPAAAAGVSSGAAPPAAGAAASGALAAAFDGHESSAAAAAGSKLSAAAQPFAPVQKEQKQLSAAAEPFTPGSATPPVDGRVLDQPYAAAHGDVHDAEPPQRLRILGADNGCSGSYMLAHEMVNGMPIWSKLGALEARFLFSTASGHWRVSDTPEDFATGYGWLISEEHGGLFPNQVTGWRQEGPGDDIDPAVAVVLEPALPASWASLPQSWTKAAQQSQPQPPGRHEEFAERRRRKQAAPGMSSPSPVEGTSQWHCKTRPDDSGGPDANPLAIRTELNHSQWMADFRAAHESAQLRRPEMVAQFDQLLSDSQLCARPVGSTEIDIDVDRILELVDQNQVVFVVTETGSGKSTKVPWAVADAAARKGGRVRVAAAEPRRTATVRLAARAAELNGLRVGGRIGHWIRGERVGGRDTQLWYMTSFTLLLRLLDSPLSPAFSHVIIDEFHERQPDVEVAVALLRLCLRRGSSLKLILMSATLNTEDWISYFAGCKVGVYSAGGSLYPVKSYFLEDCSTLTGMAVMPARRFTPGCVPPSVVDNMVLVAQSVLKFLAPRAGPGRAILVFLPGRLHVDVFQSWASQELGDTVHCVPWHSAVDIHHIQRAIAEPPPPGKCKIYLATDIAEVSVTLPDAVFVVDLCLLKRPYITPGSKVAALFPPLVLQWYSRGNMEQRRGRVGRTQPGFYFALLSQQHLEQLQAYPLPPICHSRLDDLTLHLLRVCSRPRELYSLCRRAPIPHAIDCAIDALIDAGCVEPAEGAVEQGDAGRARRWAPFIAAAAAAEERSTGTDVANSGVENAPPTPPPAAGAGGEWILTFRGRLQQRVPVQLRAGACVHYGALLGSPVLELMVLAAAAVSVPHIFTPRQEHCDPSRRLGADPIRLGAALDRAEKSMKAVSLGSSSDIVACVNVYLEWLLQQSQPGSNLDEWCTERSVLPDRLVQMRAFARHIWREARRLLQYLPEEMLPPGTLAAELGRAARTVALLCCAAHLDQGLRVTAGAGAREQAIAYFAGASALPDMHHPTLANWHQGSAVVCASLALRPAPESSGPSTAPSFTASLCCHVFAAESDYFLACLMFVTRLLYWRLHDDEGAYTVFRVRLNGVERVLQCDASTSAAVLDFRRKLQRVMALCRSRWEHAQLSDAEFAVLVPDGDTAISSSDGAPRDQLRAARKDLECALLFDLLATDTHHCVYEADFIDDSCPARPEESVLSAADPSAYPELTAEERTAGLGWRDDAADDDDGWVVSQWERAAPAPASAAAAAAAADAASPAVPAPTSPEAPAAAPAQAAAAAAYAVYSETLRPPPPMSSPPASATSVDADDAVLACGIKGSEQGGGIAWVKFRSGRLVTASGNTVRESLPTGEGFIERDGERQWVRPVSMAGPVGAAQLGSVDDWFAAARKLRPPPKRDAPAQPAAQQSVGAVSPAAAPQPLPTQAPDAAATPADGDGPAASISAVAAVMAALQAHGIKAG